MLFDNLKKNKNKYNKFIKQEIIKYIKYYKYYYFCKVIDELKKYRILLKEIKQEKDMIFFIHNDCKMLYLPNIKKDTFIYFQYHKIRYLTTNSIAKVVMNKCLENDTFDMELILQDPNPLNNQCDYFTSLFFPE